MTYQWKLPGIIPVDAQTAGEELDRIYSTAGELTPAKVVDASRPATAPLHPCFEWDDAVAAEKWRENQAGAIIRNIAVTVEADNVPVDVRAFVSVDREYQPIQLVMNNEDKLNSLLLAAIGELRAFENKYRVLNELRPVIEAIQAVNRKGAA